MYWAVRTLILNYQAADENAVQVPLLIGAVGLGAAVYAAISLSLWIILGKPSGPESYAIARIIGFRRSDDL
jgi:hypothetical protein